MSKDQRTEWAQALDVVGRLKFADRQAVLAKLSDFQRTLVLAELRDHAPEFATQSRPIDQASTRLRRHLDTLNDAEGGSQLGEGVRAFLWQDNARGTS